MIDNGMPVVVLRAQDMGITGQESREALDANLTLKTQLEKIRLACGPMMNLDDVTDKTVPKMTMVSEAIHGGAISTRTFIPHRCHASISVLGAVSVATACLLDGSQAAEIADIPNGEDNVEQNANRQGERWHRTLGRGGKRVCKHGEESPF